jgi:oligopeptide/dipeptide ABC transporter ATP-binding protein
MNGEHSQPLLDVRHLTVAVTSPEGVRALVPHSVGFTVQTGETLALVGESGCGKSLTALAIPGLIPPACRIVAGQVGFDGQDLVGRHERELERLRGTRIGYIFQEPTTALNPVFTIGDQIAETLRVHGIARGRRAWEQAVEWLDTVRIPEPARRAHDYPHQLSGGLKQRALIALTLACRPSLVIADEPTTALDVTLQAQILDLLRELRGAYNLALLLISHDLAVVAGIADRIAVMYAGRIVEQGPIRPVFAQPAHPYTRALLAAIPGRTSGRRLQTIDGAVPALTSLPTGCAFGPRCPVREAVCSSVVPPTIDAGPGRTVSCHLRGY